MTAAELNALATRILDAAFAVHTELGPGLLESAYCACLQAEIRSRGLRVRSQVPVPLVYRDQKLEEVGFRMDLLVEEEIVLELKALESIAPVHVAQLVSYLKLADKRLGYLLNFNTERLCDGIYRRVNKL